jgi:hypothetical protein
MPNGSTLRRLLLLTIGAALFSGCARDYQPDSPATLQQERLLRNQPQPANHGPLSDIYDRLQDLYAFLIGNNAMVNARRMEDSYFADERRKGMVYFADRDWGRKPPYTTRYGQIASADRVPLVRATAVRSLNRARDASQTAVLVARLNDENELVRIEAAKALVNLPDETAVPRLIEIVGNVNENRDLRIAAADALRHYSRLDVARALTLTLSQREFAVSWQARRSLRVLTGVDFGYNEQAWLNHLTGANPFG